MGWVRVLASGTREGTTGHGTKHAQEEAAQKNRRHARAHHSAGTPPHAPRTQPHAKPRSKNHTVPPLSPTGGALQPTAHGTTTTTSSRPSRTCWQPRAHTSTSTPTNGPRDQNHKNPITTCSPAPCPRTTPRTTTRSSSRRDRTAPPRPHRSHHPRTSTRQMYLKLGFTTDEHDVEWMNCFLYHAADCGKTHKIGGTSISFVSQNAAAPSVTRTFSDDNVLRGGGNRGGVHFCKVASLLNDDGSGLCVNNELQIELKLRLDDRHCDVNNAI